MVAMILAAGRGERLRPLTDTTPKALVRIGDKSLLERHLERLSRAGVTTVIINLGWLGDRIAAAVGSGERFGLNVIYSPEYDRVLDTGGGILRALPVIGRSPFWVINADIHTDYALPDIDLPPEVLAHLVLVPTPGYRKHGDFSLAGRKVVNQSPRDLTYSGIACYRPGFFAGAPGGRFSVVPMLRAAADDGRVEGSIHRGQWHDVGTPERLAEVNRREPL